MKNEIFSFHILITTRICYAIIRILFEYFRYIILPRRACWTNLFYWYKINVTFHVYFLHYDTIRSILCILNGKIFEFYMFKYTIVRNISYLGNHLREEEKCWRSFFTARARHTLCLVLNQSCMHLHRIWLLPVRYESRFSPRCSPVEYCTHTYRAYRSSFLPVHCFVKTSPPVRGQWFPIIAKV